MNAKGILKISDAASLAIHTMVLLATHPDETFSIPEIAAILKASQAHLAKVAQRLAKAGLVSSTRGRKGGFKLEGDASQVSLLEVYEAIEGPLVATQCLLSERVCRGQRCVFGDLLTEVNRQVRDYLANTCIGELTDVFGLVREKRS